MKKIFLAAVFCLAMLSIPGKIFAEEQKIPVNLYIFHLETCSHCKDELEFLKKLEKKYDNLSIHKFEVSSGFKNRSLFSNVIKKYNLGGGVPVTVIGEEHFEGFDEEKMGPELEKIVNKCSSQVCSSWLDEATGEGEKKKEEKKQEVETKTKAQEGEVAGAASVFGGKINFDNDASIVLIGAVLGLADGINPCMFSVLLFLLTYLLAIGSPKKARNAGVAFAITTFALYFSLMLGLFKVIDILNLHNAARWLITIFAFLAGVLMVKDYFFYGKWVSLEIPERFRPKIKELIERGTIPSAIFLALLSGIVELPCTSALPLAYVNIIATRGSAVVPNLLVYNLFFVLPLLLIIAGVFFAWTKIEKLEAARVKFRRHMKLGAGILLLALALAFWMKWL